MPPAVWIAIGVVALLLGAEGVVRGVVDTLVKVIQALNEAGVELIGDHQPSAGGGRGVRLKEPGS